MTSSPADHHPRPRRPRRDRATAALARIVLRHPIAIVAVAAILAVAGGLSASRWLALDADTNSLIAADRPFMRLYREFLEEFGDLEYLYIVVDAAPDGRMPPDPRRAAIAEAAVDELLASLREIPSLPAVHGRVEPAEQDAIATRAMPLDRLRQLAASDRSTLPPLAAGDAAEAVRIANADLEQLLSRGARLSGEERRRLAAGAMLALDTVAGAAAANAPAESLAHPLPPGRLRSDSGRLHFVAVLPDKRFNQLAVIEEPLRQIRERIDAVAARHPEIEIGLTGKPVLQADELATTDRDMVRAASGAAAAIAILFTIVFRGWKRPLLALVAFLFAFGWTYGFATFAVGRLNLLSIVFMLVLVGVGLDYGVHMVARYLEARRRRISSGAVRTVLRTVVPANLTGGATSAAVFLLAVTTSFQGLRELGLIAGAGLLFCVLSMSTVLPAMLHLAERGRRRDRTAIASRSAAALHPPPPSRRIDLLRTVGPILLAAAGVAIAGRGLRFETNLLELQAEGLPSVEWEHRILDDNAAASWFGAVVVDTPEDAAKVAALAAAHPEVARTSSLLDLVPFETPERSLERDDLRRRFRDAVALGGPAAATVPDADRLRQAAGLVRRLAAAAAAAGEASAPSIAASADRLDRLVDEQTERPEATQQRLAIAASTAASRLRSMADGDAMPLRDALPAAMRAELVSPSGRLLVKVHPREDLWSEAPLAAFVATLRSIDPDATGVPMTQLESIRDMSRSFAQMLAISILAVALFVWIDFRSLAATLVCIAALLVGLGWTAGAMVLLGIPLNLANFFAIPILAGLGIDSSVHMVHRAREQRGRRIRYGATARAVLLTAATTAIGFGSLVFASHRGLQSLGATMLVGSIACMLAAVAILPGLLRLAGWERR